MKPDWSPKYPRTPYWPWSPSIAEGDKTHGNPGRFVGEEVIITEKLDGGNTMLHNGNVYARSVAAPSTAKWMAMVKKHHAWKVFEPDVWLYGEDIYGVHSIEYDPVSERDTFQAFALRRADGSFASYDELQGYAMKKDIFTVPVLFRGRFKSVSHMRAYMTSLHSHPSVLGGEREGAVLRLARGFSTEEFPDCVCKSVREGHVQTDEHWTRNWKPCRIKERANQP